MRTSKIKLPDGRLARPVVSKLEMFLRNNAPPPASAGTAAPPPSEPPALSPPRPPDYRTAEFDPERLQGHEVTILGAGSVGSYLAYFMAIARLILHVVDFKRVEYKHVRGRTLYDSTSIGLFKVEALKRKIEADRLGASVRAYPFNVAEISTPDLRVMFQRSLLVVLALDDPDQILRVSDLAYPLVELMQLAMHAQGKSSHVTLSIPIVTPCLRCTLGVLRSQDVQRLDSEPANSLDIIALAQQAAGIGLDIAHSKVTGRPPTRWDSAKNLIYIANMREELSPDGPGLHYESSQKRPGCPICSIPRPLKENHDGYEQSGANAAF